MKSIYENTTFKPGEIGIFTGLSMPVYREAPGLAGSDLETLTNSPAAFHAMVRKEATPDMEFGTIFHTMLLAGTLDVHIVPQVYLGPESTKAGAPMVEKPWNWNANVCKAWRESHQDKPIMPKFGNNSATLLEAMVNKTKAHPLAASLISRLTPEVSLFARCAEHPVLCKGRPDGLIKGETTIIVEVKSTRDASTAAFSREIMKRGYYKKAAWYRMLLHELRVSPIEFWFIAVEKSETPRVNVRRLAERAMDKGDLDNDDSLTLYRKCKLANFWPELPDAAFPGESDATPVIDLPDYAYGASADVIKGLTAPDDGDLEGDV